MGIHDDLLSTISDELRQKFEPRNGYVVPRSQDVSKGDGVTLNAAYLYADLADSSGLAQSVPPHDAARVIRAYVNVAVKTIRHHDGHIRSFDGDRVMGVYVGADKESRAGRTALAIEAYVRKLRALIPREVPSIRRAGWNLGHGVGIDVGTALIVRGGIRNNADLISVGSAPNVAAKLSSLRDRHKIYATEEAYIPMSWDVSYKGAPNDPSSHCMWDNIGEVTIGGRSVNVRASYYGWPYG